MISLKYIKQYGIFLAAFIAADQLIKIIINTFFFKFNFDIISGIFTFSPVINPKLSWGSYFIDFLNNPFFIYTLNILIIIIYISGYSFYRSRVEKPGIWATLIFLFGLSGSICGLIDRLFWGGSLDYIKIPHFFVFDLKDCYLTVSEIILICVVVRHNKEIKIRDYLKYCFKRKNAKI
ncbi:MAG: putative lipoprotein signal peptidase [Clostridia bacterium]|nr:putative lipoprotein signal peptidase [Clostridia bacterium]